MDIFSIVLIVMGAIDVLAGLSSIVTGKVYMMGSAGQYTDDFLRKFALPLGISNVLSGAGLIVLETLKKTMFTVSGAPVQAGIVVMLPLLLLGLFAYLASRKILVKKTCAC